MKPAPPRSNALAIADTRVAHPRRANGLLIQDAPAVVEHGGPAETGEEPPEIELGVLGMVGDDEHGVRALERRVGRDGASAESADDVAGHEIVVAAQLEAGGAEERQHGED